jgi:hypothetical protein
VWGQIGNGFWVRIIAKERDDEAQTYGPVAVPMFDTTKEYRLSGLAGLPYDYEGVYAFVSVVKRYRKHPDTVELVRFSLSVSGDFGKKSIPLHELSLGSRWDNYRPLYSATSLADAKDQWARDTLALFARAVNSDQDYLVERNNDVRNLFVCNYLTGRWLRILGWYREHYVALVLVPSMAGFSGLGDISVVSGEHIVVYPVTRNAEYDMVVESLPEDRLAMMRSALGADTTDRLLHHDYLSEVSLEDLMKIRGRNPASFAEQSGTAWSAVKALSMADISASCA